MKKYRSLFVLLLLLVIGHTQGFAQCAMCRTTAESDLNNNSGSIAHGLNTGILYLMSISYLVIMTGGYFFFKKQVDAKLKAWRDKIFPSKAKHVN